MTWLIFTIILGLAFWAGVLIAFIDGDGPGFGAAIAAVAALMTIIMSTFFMVHTVGQRQVAIVYNFSGTITGKKDPGVVMTWPWQHVKKENVGLQREDFDLDASNSAVSKDQQSIFARVTVNYQVQPSKVVELFKQVGPSWKQTLLDSRVLQDFKEVTSTFTAAQITTKRPELRARTKRRLEKELDKYDIRVIDFFVRNIGYSAAYERAINAKNVQVQRSLQAQAKVDQARAEGEQQLAKAQNQARANKLLARSITPALVTLKSIEKLNPRVQVIYVPAGSNLFLPSLAPKAGK